VDEIIILNLSYMHFSLNVIKPHTDEKHRFAFVSMLQLIKLSIESLCL